MPYFLTSISRSQNICYYIFMAKKQEVSSKILNTLSGKQAMSVKDLKNGLSNDSKQTYAFARSIKNMTDLGLIETIKSDHEAYARITPKGRQKLTSLKLDSKNGLISKSWDGKWRIILLDLPESRKAERESIRYLLKKANFVCLKNSAWISPYPFEHMFENIKKDLGLKNELIILTTNTVDETSEKYFFENFSK
jgi:phenylacetic acid degradation operon negative regulatory protein